MLPLGGCLLSGDKPDPGLDIPLTYEGGPKNPAVAEAALPTLDWWRGFHSKELTELIEEARAANLDIAAAVAQIEQADAQSRVAGAPLLPGITFNGAATRSRPSQSTGNSGGSGSGASEFNNLNGSLSASYEIDFWGKNRSALRAAEENAVASRYNREVVGLATVVSVANTYFQVLAAQDRLRIARENVASATRILNLIKQQFSAGTASDLNVAQQESLVNTQRAAVPPLVQTLRQSEAALALLIARPPERVAIRGGGMRGVAIPRVTPGLPSELLAQRPDIRQAEANLAAADANVVNARAQLLPSITLTGEGGYQSAVLKTLLRPESAFYTLTAGLTQPIFEGGKLLGNLDLQKGDPGAASADLPQGRDLRLYRRRQGADRGARDPHWPSGCSATWSTVRAGLSISPTSSCTPAPSTSLRCCRSSRHYSRPRTRWRWRGWRAYRRSSVFIRRSAAAGCRSRWRPPMHGEMPKTDHRGNGQIAHPPQPGDRADPDRCSGGAVLRLQQTGAAAAPQPVRRRRRAGAGAGRRPRPRPTCRSISTPSAPSRRSIP